MENKFRFSPIQTKEKLEQTIHYIVEQSDLLTDAVFGHTLNLDTVCIFAHYVDEFMYMDRLLRSMGPVSKFTQGTTLYVDANIEYVGYKIKLLGIRQPQPDRPEVGYADFPVNDYDKIKQTSNPYIHEITSGRGEKLLEIKREGFDIRGYIVRTSDHQ